MFGNGKVALYAFEVVHIFGKLLEPIRVNESDTFAWLSSLPNSVFSSSPYLHHACSQEMTHDLEMSLA